MGEKSTPLFGRTLKSYEAAKSCEAVEDCVIPSAVLERCENTKSRNLAVNVSPTKIPALRSCLPARKRAPAVGMTLLSPHFRHSRISAYFYLLQNSNWFTAFSAATRDRKLPSHRFSIVARRVSSRSPEKFAHQFCNGESKIQCV